MSAQKAGPRLYAPKIIAALRELGGRAKTRVIRDTILETMLANGEPVDESDVSGEPKYQNDMRFARMYLVNAGKLQPKEIAGYGYWQLTDEGWSMSLDEKTISSVFGLSSQESVFLQKTLPEALQEDLPGISQGDIELKNALLNLKDKGFERLCAAIMTANAAQSISVTGKSGDGGIDGVATFHIDSLGLLHIRVGWQSKRYNPATKVQPSEIREFRGALDGRFQHGIFFTTSRFSVKANEEGSRLGSVPITLVDIASLISILKLKNIGVQVKPDGTHLVNNTFFDNLSTTNPSGPSALIAPF